MKAKDVFMYALGALVTMGFFGTLVVLIFIEIPEANEKMLYMIVGAEISAFTGVVMYFYGSSASSSDKNKILADQLKSNKPPGQ